MGVAAPGDLETFGTSGVFTGPDTTSDAPYGEVIVDLDAQGRPIVAWTSDNEDPADTDDLRLVVARLTTGGTLDTTFNPTGTPAGTVEVDFPDRPGVDTTAAGIAAGPGGTVIALGAVDMTSASSFAIGLVRLTSTGAYDTTFSSDGRLVPNLGATYSPYPSDLALDGAGNMLVSGTGLNCTPTCSHTGFVARFTAAGVPDAAWDGDGHREWGPAGLSEVFGIEALPGGGVVGSGWDRSLNEAFALRSGVTGTPDTTFSGDGYVTTSFGANETQDGALGFSAVQDGSGRVLITGQATVNNVGARFAVARFTAAGLPDGAWGTGTPQSGVVWLPQPTTRGYDVAMTCSGERVLVSGIGQVDRGPPFGVNNSYALARLTGAGALDTTFGATQPSPGLVLTGIVGSSRVDLQACKLEYSIVSPK